MPPVPQVVQQINQEQNQQQNGPDLSSLHCSLPADCDKKHVILVSTPVPVQQQENEILQRISALRREGLWSLKRLPKLQEAPRHKSHHDYLLEEMQWMATDFVQERRWKMLILSVVHYHEDLLLHKETYKKREVKKLRAVAAFTAREIEHFWTTIKQVVDLKRQAELEERRKKVLNSQNISKKEITDSLTKKESLQKEVVFPDLLTSTVEKHMAGLADIAAAAEALLPKGTAPITTVVESESPSLLHGTLRDYQKAGLEWLAKLYKMNLNGILADEAGLGKTVQVVAFFAHLACNEGNWGPILVISQNFNVLKWETELKCWCPALKILLYLGNPGELFKTRQEWTDPNNFNVCIASCNQFFQDYEAFMKVQWSYLVLDERQNGNNLTEKHWDAIFNLQSHHHLLLMDTVLPTAVKDLWAIACFLIPGTSQSYLDFMKVEGDEDHYHRTSVRLQRAVRSFILRRSKTHVEKQLPRKYEHVLPCTLSERQKSMYQDILTQPRTQEHLRSGHFVSVLPILTQLLRVCNHPDLVCPRLPSSSCLLDPLEFTTASLVLNALGWDLWKHADRSLFDVIGLENKVTCYEAQVLPKLKVTRKLIEEIYCSPSSPRLEPVKLKPNRLFTPVLYGQKPEGRTRDFSRCQLQHTVDTATVTANHHEETQRQQHFATLSENQHRKASKIVHGPMASTAGTEEASAEPEKPVMLQFRGKTFTLSYRQFCLLIGRQSLKHQGKGGIEEKRQLREHLDKIYFGNERRCSRAPLYGRDLLEICSWITECYSARINKWHRVGLENCLPYPSTSEVLRDPLQELTLTLKQQQIALKDVVTRYLCVLPAVAVAPPRLYVANAHTHEIKVLKLNLKEQILPYFHSMQQIVRPPFLQFPDPRLLQHDSGKLGALAVLLRKLKARGDRVLILTQMIPMLDILELFLNFHFLRYKRVHESGAHSWQNRVVISIVAGFMLALPQPYSRGFCVVQSALALPEDKLKEAIKNFNQDKRFFCAILSSHTPSTGVSHVDANTVVFYDTDLDPLMDEKANEWCDKIATERDVHIYRLVSGNSVEERLLKKGIKHLIEEVAAQGGDCSTDLLTQVLGYDNGDEDSRRVPEVTLSEIRRDRDSEWSASRAAMAPSQLEQLASFVEQMKPVEKYALNFLELFHASGDQKSQKVIKEFKTASIKWEYQHAKMLEKAKEEFQQEVQDDLLTYTREDAYNVEFVCEGPDGEVEIMPLWAPPVLPETQDDVYTDPVMCLMYTSTPIPESKLPPLFVRSTRKRQRPDLSSSGERKKHCHRRMVVPPPSLFEQVTPRTLKTRQKSKAQKSLLRVHQKIYFARPSSAFQLAAAAEQDSPAWIIAEDLALLKVVKQVQTLPLNLTTVSPAQTANWDFVSDVISSSNYAYRSPEQCKNHYRKAFEGKSSGYCPLRVRQAYAKDQDSERTQIYMNHFELMTMTARKRSSSKRSLAETDDKLLPLSEPTMMQEKALNEDPTAPQLPEQQPRQKEEEEQIVEQI